MVIILYCNISCHYWYRITLALSELCHTSSFIYDGRRVRVTSNVVESDAGSCVVEWVHRYQAYIPIEVQVTNINNGIFVDVDVHVHVHVYLVEAVFLVKYSRMT